METKRLLYLDIMKSVAMLSVVMGHVPLYMYWGGWSEAYAKSLLMGFVHVFHMPLFVFLSGLVTSADKVNIGRRSKILIPFFLIGILYTYASGLTIGDFFGSEFKQGYWYLWVIYMYYVLIKLIYILKINFWLGVVVVQISLMLLSRLLPSSVVEVLSLNLSAGLWLYFTLGIIIQKYDLLGRWLAKPIYSIAGLGCFMLCFRLNHLPSVHWITPLGIILFLLVVSQQVARTIEPIDRGWKMGLKAHFSSIGKHTLQIYTLHYFIVGFISLSFIGKLITLYPWIDLLLTPALAMTICLVCVGVARLMGKLKLGFIFGR